MLFYFWMTTTCLLRLCTPCVRTIFNTESCYRLHKNRKLFSLSGHQEKNGIIYFLPVLVREFLLLIWPDLFFSSGFWKLLCQKFEVGKDNVEDQKLCHSRFKDFPGVLHLSLLWSMKCPDKIQLCSCSCCLEKKKRRIFLSSYGVWNKLDRFLYCFFVVVFCGGHSSITVSGCLFQVQDVWTLYGVCGGGAGTVAKTSSSSSPNWWWWRRAHLRWSALYVFIVADLLNTCFGSWGICFLMCEDCAINVSLFLFYSQ